MYTKMVDFLTNYKAAIPILTEYETIIMSQKKKLNPNSVPFHSNSPKKLWKWWRELKLAILQYTST